MRALSGKSCLAACMIEMCHASRKESTSEVLELPRHFFECAGGLKVTNTNTCQSLVQTNLCCVRGKSCLAACMIEMCHASRKESTSEVLELPRHFFECAGGLKVTNTNTCQSLVQTNLCCVRGKSRLAACMIEMCHASRKESTSEVLELPRHFFECVGGLKVTNTNTCQSLVQTNLCCVRGKSCLAACMIEMCHASRKESTSEVLELPRHFFEYAGGLKVTNTNTCQSLVQTNLCCVRGKSCLAACMIEMCHASRKESTSEVLELPRHFFEMGVTGTPRIWAVLPFSEFSEP